jgi:hypothetical protein
MAGSLSQVRMNARGGEGQRSTKDGDRGINQQNKRRKLSTAEETRRKRKEQDNNCCG